MNRPVSLVSYTVGCDSRAATEQLQTNEVVIRDLKDVIVAFW